MPSFTITDVLSAPQTVNDGENGFVATNGTLVTFGPQSAVTLTGSTDIAVFGTISSLDSFAISGTFSETRITVGADGQIASTSTTAIFLNANDSAKITNAGTISGYTRGIAFTGADSTASFNLANSGTIISDGPALYVNDVFVSPGSLFANVTNSGTIQSARGDAVFMRGLINLTNSGSIVGDVSLTDVDPLDTSVFRNTGTITGNVTLNGKFDFDTRGGTVGGTVTGGGGDQIFRISSADIDITDTGTTGFDTVYSSVSYGITAGIERLELTGSADARAYGGGLADQLAGNRGDNRITGKGGNDTLEGGDGNDALRGGSGDDELRTDSGNDDIAGGDGIDTLNLGFSTAGVTVNLTTGTATGADIDSDTLSGIENVLATNAADTVTGSVAANRIAGLAGNDDLSGGSGNDTLVGGAGQDTLTGGNGDDTFVFDAITTSPPAAPDTITDFRPNRDVIDLSAINPGGSGAFAFGGADFLAQGTASVRVTQDIANGQTIVEARDTTGADPDLRIVLTGLLTLTATDFAL